MLIVRSLLNPGLGPGYIASFALRVEPISADRKFSEARVSSIGRAAR